MAHDDEADDATKTPDSRAPRHELRARTGRRRQTNRSRRHRAALPTRRGRHYSKAAKDQRKAAPAKARGARQRQPTRQRRRGRATRDRQRRERHETRRRAARDDDSDGGASDRACQTPMLSPSSDAIMAVLDTSAASCACSPSKSPPASSARAAAAASAAAASAESENVTNALVPVERTRRIRNLDVATATSNGRSTEAPVRAWPQVVDSHQLNE